jgi:hypothetical protein
MDFQRRSTRSSLVFDEAGRPTLISSYFLCLLILLKYRSLKRRPGTSNSIFRTRGEETSGNGQGRVFRFYTLHANLATGKQADSERAAREGVADWARMRFCNYVSREIQIKLFQLIPDIGFRCSSYCEPGKILEE